MALQQRYETAAAWLLGHICISTKPHSKGKCFVYPKAEKMVVTHKHPHNNFNVSGTSGDGANTKTHTSLTLAKKKSEQLLWQL